MPTLLSAFDTSAAVAKTVALGAAFNTGKSNQNPINYPLPAETVTAGTQIQRALNFNVDLTATLGGVTIHTEVMDVGDIVLLMGQTNPAENGVYTIEESPDLATRLTSAGYAEDLTGGVHGYTKPWKFNIVRKCEANNTHTNDGDVYVGNWPCIIGTDPIVIGLKKPVFDTAAAGQHP